MIDTVFYFAPSLEEYQSQWQNGDISQRTIVFVPPKNIDSGDAGTIYKGGVAYGNTTNSNIERIVEEMLASYVPNWPKATKNSLGGIIVGDYLNVDGNGKLNVDVDGMFDAQTIKQKINLIIQNYINSHNIDCGGSVTYEQIAPTSGTGSYHIGDLYINGTKHELWGHDVSGGGGTTSVEYIPEITSNTQNSYKIGDIKVNGQSTTIYGVDSMSEDLTGSYLQEDDITYEQNDQIPTTGTGSYRIGNIKVGSKTFNLYGKDFAGENDNAKDGGYYEPAFKTFDENVTLAEVQSAMPTNGIADLSNGWAHSAENIDGNHSIWMINRYVTGQGAYGDWQGPWRISGANGENGVDGDTMEYIYFRSNTETPQFPDKDGAQPAAEKAGLTPQDDDFVPLGWTDNPKGVDQNNRYEWMAFRIKTGASQGVGGTWSNFTGPILWSSYGVNGIDGDGIEYIFYAMAEDGVRPENDPAGLPSSWYSREGDYQTEFEYKRGNWQDDPQDLESLGFGARQFVSVRKKYADNEGEKPYWHPYSDYTLWSYYAHDGHSNTVIPAVVYSIQVTSSTVAVEYGEESNTVSGIVSYKIMRSEGSDRSFVATSNSYGITTKAMLGGNIECFTSYWDYEYTAMVDNAYTGSENFVEVLVYENNTPVASTVVPIIIPGPEGPEGKPFVQSIESPIMRMRGEWVADPDPLYNDGTNIENGIKYTDIVVYNGLYFKCNSYGTTKRPQDQDGITPQEWGKFSIADDSYINNLIANNAYIKNLTAKQIVVTDANEKPVAGMLNGMYIPTQLQGKTNNNGVRIFAGNVPNNGDVSNAPFTVDNDGKLKANNAEVKGSITATSFNVVDSNDNTTIEFTTFTNDLATNYPNILSLTPDLVEGDPVGLVYSGGQLKYFFEFAPVKVLNFSAEDEVFYNISGATSRVTLQVGPTYFYVTSQGSNYHKYIKTPSTNGTIVNNQDSLWEKGRSHTAFIDRSPNGHYMYQVVLFREVIFVDGVKQYTGKVRLLDSGISGSNIQSYKPSDATHTVRKDSIYSSGNESTINVPVYADTFEVHTLIDGVTNNTYTEDNTNPFVVGILESHSSGQNNGITDRNLLDPNLETYQNS